MPARLPSFPLLWIFATAVLSAGGCGPRAGAEGGATPAATSRIAPTQPNLPNAPPVDLGGPSQAPAILDTAIRTLDARRGVSARIRQQIDLFDRQLVGSGSYVQQGGGGDCGVRLELRIKIAEGVASLLQVSSLPDPGGRYLWTYRKLGDDETLSRIDLGRVAKALEDAGRPAGPTIDGLLSALGGLPRLLRGLQSEFDFDAAQPGRLGQMPVWRLTGHWRADRLAEILPDQKAAIEAAGTAELDRLPEHLPEQVVLMLGQEDLFPYRIEYRRGTDKQPEAQVPGRAMVTVEFFEVEFDPTIDPARFAYDPAGIKYDDETDRTLRSLGVTP